MAAHARLPSLLLPPLLGGCLPVHAPAPGEPTALLRPARTAMPLICANGKPIRLVAEADGYARISAGRPITVIAQFEGHDFVCMPAATFTAQPGARYVQTLRVVSRTCHTDIAMESGATVASAPAGSYGCRGRP